MKQCNTGNNKCECDVAETAASLAGRLEEKACALRSEQSGLGSKCTGDPVCDRICYKHMFDEEKDVNL
jgi:hypothetical protein